VAVTQARDPHVAEVVKTAHEELRQLMRQRADIMKRIGTLKQTIVGLANLFGDDILSEDLLELVDRKSGGRQPGFTKACRMVLMEAERPLSGARSLRADSATAARNLAAAQRSAGVGDHGAESPGGLRRGAKRGAREWPSSLVLGCRSGSGPDRRRRWADGEERIGPWFHLEAIFWKIKDSKIMRPLSCDPPLPSSG
jgi:hypothetical protein